MAGSLNKVLLIGRLGKDPELREFQSGGKVCNFSLATSETWKDSSTGERQERTSWHNIAIFNERLAEIAEQYLDKGSKVYVEGKLQTRKWQDKETGADRYTTEIVGNELTMLDSKNSSGMNEMNESQNFERNTGQSDKAQEDFNEDDIPF